MRRIVTLLLVVVAFAGLIGAGRMSRGTAAQDAATPTAAGIHPIVGSWIVDSESGPADAPAFVVHTADGGVIGTGAGGALSGSWEATGPRTATSVLVGIFGDEGGYFYIRGESEVDASGMMGTGSYTWTDVAADGTVLDTGQDVASSWRLVVPPAEAVEMPLAGVPTWTPATPVAGTPTE